ncbi:Kinesin-like protein kif27 [Blyttiomyces sp. JEL0837]|nr:Kinesin-like protein kif27 [Blyttiomyces sp. JEL0837]
MAVYYLNSFEFRYDVVANLPLDFIALGWVGSNMDDALYMLALVRLSKMIRAVRIVAFFRQQEKKLHAQFTVQILKFLSYLITLEHSIACMWFAIACPKGDSTSCKNPSWVIPPLNNENNLFGSQTLVTVTNGKQEFNTGLSSLYIQSFYWTVTTMTTTGYGDIIPRNDSERAFALFSMTSGVLFYGYISGTIASALSNMDSRRVAYQQKMDAIKQYMNDRDMEQDMQERVLEYYDYMWERNKGIDVKNLFEDMPSTFRSEVALSLNNAIIDKATIFRGCSIGFKRKIAIAMKLYLFTANEYVIYKGDLGTEMYFITQGRIDIFYSNDMKRPTASLIEGAHFGEFQIMLGHRHEYSAKAICNTDIYVLFKEDVEKAFEAYPEDKLLVCTATEERYKQALAARQSRQAAATANLDMEEEFGTGAASPKPDVNATGSVPYGRRKMSGFLAKDAKEGGSRSSMKSKESGMGMGMGAGMGSKENNIGSVSSGGGKRDSRRASNAPLSNNETPAMPSVRSRRSSYAPGTNLPEPRDTRISVDSSTPALTNRLDPADIDKKGKIMSLPSVSSEHMDSPDGGAGAGAGAGTGEDGGTGTDQPKPPST